MSDAFSRKWGPDLGLVWLNTPYSMMEEVVAKIQEDGTTGVLICPDWPNAAWRWRIQSSVKKKYFYAPGVKCF